MRFITDLERWEDGAWNHRAGQDIIRYFRSKDAAFKEIPILVYTSFIEPTGFVKAIPFTESTTNPFMVDKYINELACHFGLHGMTFDDGFNRRNEKSLLWRKL